jgi:hypothetical protein
VSFLRPLLTSQDVIAVVELRRPMDVMERIDRMVIDPAGVGGRPAGVGEGDEL